MRRVVTILAVIVLGLVLGVLAGCTWAQRAAWVDWHRDDPDAAIAWLDTDEAQAMLADEHPSVAVEPGICSSYAPLFVEYGLPVSTFERIAWRESGCDHTSFVRDSDDLGGGLLGLNLRAGADRWREWCGLTVSNVTDAETNVRCAAAAYRRMGMTPWRT